MHHQPFKSLWIIVLSLSVPARNSTNGASSSRICAQLNTTLCTYYAPKSTFSKSSSALRRDAQHQRCLRFCHNPRLNQELTGFDYIIHTYIIDGETYFYRLIKKFAYFRWHSRSGTGYDLTPWHDLWYPYVHSARLRGVLPSLPPNPMRILYRKIPAGERKIFQIEQTAFYAEFLIIFPVQLRSEVKRWCRIMMRMEGRCWH